MKSLFFGVFLLVQASNPIPGKILGSSPVSQKPKNAEKSNDDKNAAPNITVIVKQPDTPQVNPDENEKKEDIEIQKQLAKFTKGLVYVGLLQAVILFLTLIWIKKQANHLEKHAIEFKKLAEAARDSASAVLNSERAWMDIYLGAPEILSEQEGFDNYGDYSIRIRNHGRTIARIEGFQFHPLIMSGELDIGAFDTKSVNFDYLLGSGDHAIAAGAINFISEIKDWEPFRNGEKRAYARIGVTYRDVVDSKIVRQTFAVYVWDVFADEPLRQTKYNFYT